MFLGFCLLERRSESCPGQELPAVCPWGHGSGDTDVCTEVLALKSLVVLPVGSPQALLPRARLSSQLAPQSRPQLSSTLPSVVLQPLLVTEATGWALFLGNLLKKTAFSGPALLHSRALVHPCHHPVGRACLLCCIHLAPPGLPFPCTSAADVYH